MEGGQDTTLMNEIRKHYGNGTVICSLGDEVDNPDFWKINEQGLKLIYNRIYEILTSKDVDMIKLILYVHSDDNGKKQESSTLYDIRPIFNIIKTYLDGNTKNIPYVDTDKIGKPKSHPNTKVYIANLSCCGASELNCNTTIEKEIQDIFHEHDGKIFYAKSKDKKNIVTTFFKEEENGWLTHIITKPFEKNQKVDELRKLHQQHQTEPAFKYYHLSGGKLKSYKELYDNTPVWKKYYVEPKKSKYAFLEEETEGLKQRAENSARKQVTENDKKQHRLKQEWQKHKLQQAQKNFDFWKLSKKKGKIKV